MGKGKQEASSKSPEAIDHARFLQMLTKEFPEVQGAFDEYSRGLLHCEIGTFARLTEEAMDQGRFWQAEKYFNFVEKVRQNATSEVQNAIDVSYIKYLAFSEVTDSRRQVMKRLPKVIRAVLLEIDGRWRWA
jgi:hypothetical protein